MTQTSERASDEHFIDEVQHPAARQRSGVLSARQTIVVVVVALISAALLDSHAFVRAGEGMTPGRTRDTTLAVAKPLDRFASSTGLNGPRHAFDGALRRDDHGGGDIAGGDVPPLLSSPDPSAAALPDFGLPSSGPLPTGASSSGASGSPSAVAPIAGAIAIRQPTRQHPLRVLVTGDSLSTYVAEQMDQLGHGAGLVRIKGVWADGTGLSNPSFYNWQKAARSGVRKYHPEIVVMVIGGNDGWNMKDPSGRVVRVGTDDWVDEYARRVAAIMRTYLAGGVQAVYWSGPPMARDGLWNRLYGKVNSAAARAAASVARTQYVDLYRGTAVDGHYAEKVPFGSRLIQHARQPDGVHWTLDGSLLPASLELAAISEDVGHPVR